mmetsp:Transcript_47785/g.93327  ORF Transcript_47785/g.93327 Transcript_47785/m.93327 type:complete len:258 (-) Transcript_47785:78-851(-)
MVGAAPALALTPTLHAVVARAGALERDLLGGGGGHRRRRPCWRSILRPEPHPPGALRGAWEECGVLRAILSARRPGRNPPFLPRGTSGGGDAGRLGERLWCLCGGFRRASYPARPAAALSPAFTTATIPGLVSIRGDTVRVSAGGARRGGGASATLLAAGAEHHAGARPGCAGGLGRRRGGRGFLGGSCFRSGARGGGGGGSILGRNSRGWSRVGLGRGAVHGAQRRARGHGTSGCLRTNPEATLPISPAPFSTEPI